MHTTPHAGAPYREPSSAASTADAASPPSLPRAQVLATVALLVATGLSACASAHLTHLLQALVSGPAPRHGSVYGRAPRHAPSLREAAEDLARRQRAPLVIAPDVPMGALRGPVPDALDGGSREAVRALDAWAAMRGLWFHDVDGVLHLERAAHTAELDCDDTLDACATRLERLASVTVQRSGEVGLARVHLRLTPAVSALAATRDALTLAGFAVDARGRTLWVASAPASAPRPPGAPPRVLRRADLARWLRASPSALGGARIAPVARGRRVVGVRVLGVRRDGVLAALGLAEGDVILQVNGLDIATPDRCLEAYTRLRQQDEVVLEIERRGRRVTQRYALV